jgi:hypothetical protein
MKKIWYRVLPGMALTSGILVIILLVLGAVLKPSNNRVSPVNRKIALDKLKQIRVENADINSKAFLDYFEKTLNCSVIDTKWLISEKGEIIYTNGTMAQSTPLHSNIYSFEDAQSQGLIAAVDFNMDSLQKRIMLIAARIRCEGEHNDIFGHLVIPLKTSSNVLVGFVGVAYNLDAKTPSFQNYYLIIIALVFCFLLYWLLLPLWVYFDCRERNNKYVLWTLFVLIGNLPAYIAYLLTRK